MAEIKALVVDNNPVIRKILCCVLEGEGCDVEAAEDGLAALDCIARRRPDIIFIDLIMPRIDGEKLGYIIRNTPELQDIFLVVLSGVALEDNDATLRIGADVCIAKGTTLTMQAHVKAALERYRRNQRGTNGSIVGLEGLSPREVIKELLISKKHREVILARMAEGVVELNHQGRIVMANSAALTLFDLPEAHVLGAALAQLLPEAGRECVNQWLAQVAGAADFTPLVFAYDGPLRQFTTFSDNSLPQKSHMQLRSLIDGVLAHELAPTAIGCQVTGGEEELAITLDPDLIRQVFVNLTQNAVDAMGATGRIEVTMDRVDGAEEAARTGQPVPNGELVRIALHDSGPGLAPALAEQVFDPSFSTKQKGAQKGMGLGVTIVHSIVKKHGGLVGIESPAGGGCTVYLYFPLQNSVVTDPRFAARAGSGRRVRVMDDEKMMRLINRKMFERYGCMVSVASTGEESVELYSAQMGAGKPFDLTRLDLRVHSGMGGLDASPPDCGAASRSGRDCGQRRQRQRGHSALCRISFCLGPGPTLFN